jgi:hypothetical protein
MFPNEFTHLQNEGYLMRGCFKTSLSRILAVTNTILQDEDWPSED